MSKNRKDFKSKIISEKYDKLRFFYRRLIVKVNTLSINRA